MELTAGGTDIHRWGYNDVNMSLVPGLPVMGNSSDGRRMLYQITSPCQPGDKFRLEGETRFTIDVGIDLTTRQVTGTRYTVAAAINLWWRSSNSLTWNIMGKSTGKNITSAQHHEQLVIRRAWEVPGDWPPGQSVIFALQGAAASSSWHLNGATHALQNYDRLSVDDYGNIDMMRFSPFPV
jgi:hypothetical protein